MPTSSCNTTRRCRSRNWSRKGTGLSVCTGGLGTYTYSYSQSSNAQGYNNWTDETVETQPNGTQNTYLLELRRRNAAGRSVRPLDRPALADDYQYDSSGQLIETANPSAVASYNAADANLGVVAQFVQRPDRPDRYYLHPHATHRPPTQHGRRRGRLRRRHEDRAGHIRHADPGKHDDVFRARDSSGATIVETAASTVYTTTTATGPSARRRNDDATPTRSTRGTEQVEQDTTSLRPSPIRTPATPASPTRPRRSSTQYGHAIWHEGRQRHDQLHGLRSGHRRGHRVDPGREHRQHADGSLELRPCPAAGPLPPATA